MDREAILEDLKQWLNNSIELDIEISARDVLNQIEDLENYYE